MKAIWHISWIALRELLYERIFYLFAVLALVSLGLGVLLGQLTYAEQSKLTLDFMLGATEISMILFSVFMGISMFQRELSVGSVYMVLSKPVNRISFLLGKFFGQVFAQLLVMGLMALIAMVIASRFPENLSMLATGQAFLLIYLESCIMTAVTFFFAVNAGGLTAAMASLLIYGLGHLGGVIEASLRKTDEQWLWRILKGLTPDLEIFNMKAFASYGLAVSNNEIAMVCAYAFCCVFFFLVMSALTFQRKDLIS